MKQPEDAGFYIASERIYGLGGTQLGTYPQRVEVVANVPNPRGDKLLVRTGLDQPKWRSLECYDWHARL